MVGLNKTKTTDNIVVIFSLLIKAILELHFAICKTYKNRHSCIFIFYRPTVFYIHVLEFFFIKMLSMVENTLLFLSFMKLLLSNLS